MPTILDTSEQNVHDIQCKSCSNKIEITPDNFPWGEHRLHPYYEVCFSCIERDDLEPIRDGWRLKLGRLKIVLPFTLRLLNDPKVPKRYCKDCGYLYPYLPEYFTWRKEDQTGQRKLHSYCYGCHNKYRKEFRQYVRQLKRVLSQHDMAKLPDSDEGLRLFWVQFPHLRPYRFEPKKAIDDNTRGLFD